MGKAIAGGIPAGAFGMTAEVSARIDASIALEDIDVGGIGGTLAGNALSLAAMRATLTEVLTDEAFARMLPLGDRWADGVDAGIAAHEPALDCTRLGARGSTPSRRRRPATGAEAHAGGDFALEQLLHLYALNRGILLTPFHNMALMSPATTEADVDRHTEVFQTLLSDLAVTRPCSAGRPGVTRSGHSRNDPVGHGGPNPVIPRLDPSAPPAPTYEETLLVRDARLQDPQVLDEIELYGELVIAASASEEPLSRDEIDRVLGLEHARGRRAPARLTGCPGLARRPSRGPAPGCPVWAGWP